MVDAGGVRALARHAADRWRRQPGGAVEVDDACAEHGADKLKVAAAGWAGVSAIHRARVAARQRAAVAGHALTFEALTAVSDGRGRFHRLARIAVGAAVGAAHR